jgi:DUF2075 family protein
MDYTSSECKILRDINDLKEELKNYHPGDQKDVEKIVNGKLILDKDFFKFVSLIKDTLKRNITSVLSTMLNEGFGLTEEQILILSKVLKALDKGERKNFLIKGRSGSGKSLLAFTISIEGLSRGYFTILAYINNRLLNTIRKMLKRIEFSKGIPLSSLIMFYSTGKGFGIGEKNFESWFKKRFGEREIDLIVFDEAQRMSLSVIKNSPRGKVNVYLYDDGQILLDNEAGTEGNFKNNLNNLEEFELSSSIRVPKSYLDAVKGILDGKKVKITCYDFRIFDNIISMFDELKERKREGRKIALICSFTESRGNMKNKTSWNLIDNIRIGYPLPSGFELYKNINVKVKWLMDERVEYPKYWAGELDPLKYCASIYGAQGFEADYVGVVWGRDLIWRNGWTVDPEPITDYVGKVSLKDIAKKDVKRALELLKNRYYVMLTRGIRGVYVFFEDKQTGEKVKELVSIK